jgi:hypothetical protein
LGGLLGYGRVVEKIILEGHSKATTCRVIEKIILEGRSSVSSGLLGRVIEKIIQGRGSVSGGLLKF